MVNVILDYVRALSRHIVLILLAFGLMYAGRSFACARIDQQFNGMDPDVQAGAVLFVDKRPTLTDYNYGDIVCFQHLTSREITKRVGLVAAFPGDTFEANNGKLFIDDKPKKAGYAPSLDSFIVPKMLVPRGYLLVVFNNSMGEGLDVQQHLVPASAIVGRVIR